MATARKFKHHWEQMTGRAEGWETPYADLVARYMEPHRRYHTLNHVSHCLGELEQVVHLLNDPVDAAMALWFHDAIYVPTRAGGPVHDNEEASAALASDALSYVGVPNETREHVCSLIRATAHLGSMPGRPLTGDHRFVVDIDLAILGQRWAMYEQYMRGVETEYRYDGTLSERDWLVGRSERFLRPFLQKPRIYTTDAFHERYDVRARANLQHELERLEERLYT